MTQRRGIQSRKLLSGMLVMSMLLQSIASANAGLGPALTKAAAADASETALVEMVEEGFTKKGVRAGGRILRGLLSDTLKARIMWAPKQTWRLGMRFAKWAPEAVSEYGPATLGWAAIALYAAAAAAAPAAALSEATSDNSDYNNRQKEIFDRQIREYWVGRVWGAYMRDTEFVQRAPHDLRAAAQMLTLACQRYFSTSPHFREKCFVDPDRVFLNDQPGYGADGERGNETWLVNADSLIYPNSRQLIIQGLASVLVQRRFSNEIFALRDAFHDDRLTELSYYDSAHVLANRMLGLPDPKEPSTIRVAAAKVNRGCRNVYGRAGVPREKFMACLINPQKVFVNQHTLTYETGFSGGETLYYVRDGYFLSADPVGEVAYELAKLVGRRPLREEVNKTIDAFKKPLEELESTVTKPKSVTDVVVRAVAFPIFGGQEPGAVLENTKKIMKWGFQRPRDAAEDAFARMLLKDTQQPSIQFEDEFKRYMQRFTARQIQEVTSLKTRQDQEIYYLNKREIEVPYVTHQHEFTFGDCGKAGAENLFRTRLSPCSRIPFDQVFDEETLRAFDGTLLVDTEQTMAKDNHRAYILFCGMAAFAIFDIINAVVSKNLIKKFHFGRVGKVTLFFANVIATGEITSFMLPDPHDPVQTKTGPETVRGRGLKAVQLTINDANLEISAAQESMNAGEISKQHYIELINKVLDSLPPDVEQEMIGILQNPRQTQGWKNQHPEVLAKEKAEREHQEQEWSKTHHVPSFGEMKYKEGAY